MALANVAYLLAKAGKRVLAVDFDLEAPGLSSYAPFRCAGEHAGLVEFVLQFTQTNISPDVSDFIIQCEAGGYPIWLMPAGRHIAAEYAANYSSINWQALYAEQDGFLLFEDLRQQWAQFDDLGFDYVLIDSRTGHTDIGGICTRQLPDAVVIQFLPTAQNIEGLGPIIRAIRQEKAPVRRNKIKLHFCPSNLPDLDDQELILQGLLETAERSLKYDAPAATIHHYGALDLLQQSLYSMSHPQSRLAKEYADLQQAIISENLEDRDGVLVALQRMVTAYRSGPSSDAMDPTSSLAKIDFIAERFPSDVEIAWLRANLANAMARADDELKALDVVVEGSTHDVTAPLLARARSRATLNFHAGAVSDLTRLLTVEPVLGYQVTPAAGLLRRLEPVGWRSIFENGITNAHADSGARAHLLLELLTDRQEASRLADLAAKISCDAPHGVGALRNARILALISDGQFRTARDAISTDASKLLASKFVPDVFNFAICEWAITKQPPIMLFEHVILLGAHSAARNANMLQCLALCRYVVGKPDEALEDITSAQMAAKRVNTAFSCWRYLTVDSNGMQSDLSDMFDLVSQGAPLKPPESDGLLGANAR